MFRPAALLAAAAVALAACGSSPAVRPGVIPASLAPQGSTASPIAGATLACPGDYPDSRLAFARDGTVSGRYAGQPVTGSWSATAPDTVQVLFQAGALSVRDTLRRTSTGWRGDNSSCG